MSLTRRDFIKQAAAVSAAGAIGMKVAPEALAAAQEAEKGWKWDKSVCRFCGTGCGLMLATRNAKIMYGKDRLTEPLLRVGADGESDKNGKFQPVSRDKALDVMADKFKEAYGELGPTGIGVFGSGQYTIHQGYAMAKLVKGGMRSNNIDPNARPCMASAVVGFIQTFGIDEPSANFDAEDPGDSELVGRAFENAPPVIPHNTEGLLPITTAENTFDPHFRAQELKASSNLLDTLNEGVE